MYIITYTHALVNQKDYLVQIEPPPEMVGFFETAENVRYHYYHIEYNRHEYEVVCPRYTFANGTDVIVIPWFLIPGRPYPLQIYLYACTMYSSTPEIGQRGVAEAARTKFGLETFSHSTVCRSFKLFEQARELALEKRYGEEIKDGGAGAPPLVMPAGRQTGPAAKADAKKAEAPRPAGRFPSTDDTAERREGMAKFFPTYPCDAKIGDIEPISRRFAENWHEKNRVLLI